jgi:GT2 family glycosyltransferase
MDRAGEIQEGRSSTSGPSAPTGATPVVAGGGAPLLITGMHRSGTSVVASWLAAAGVDLGGNLLAADGGNPTGYFEDLGFLDLERRMLAAAAPAGEAGHPDWGWTESERLDRGRFAEHREAALALIAAQDRNRLWGWKDPRTTLLLDFWDELLPEARYLLLYRFPWEVADSMQRLGAAVFLAHPDYAYRIWSFYNRHLLDFFGRRRERCLLVSADALLAQPERLGELLRERFGLRLPLAPLAAPGLFARLEGSDPLVSLVAATRPDAERLLRRLDAAADLSGAGLWSPAPLDGRRRRPEAGAGGQPPVDLSIVIPCHDDGEFLVEAVASAERAAAERSELLVVNDGSREERTLEVLDVLRRAGYTVIDQEQGGVAAARNRAIREARGRYLLPLDADNRLRPGFPAAAVSILDAEPAVGVVYGDREEFGFRSGTVGTPEFDLDGLLRANFIDACAVVRREVWEQCGGYDGTMPAQGWEDWELWICAAERGWRFHRLPGITFDYRVRPGSISSHLHSAEVGTPLRLHMIDKHLDLYRRRLPGLLTAQHEAARVEAERASAVAERDRLETENREMGRRLAEADRERERLVEAAAREAERLAEAEQERLGLVEERDRLNAELDRYRGRVGFMEDTRAWRLRALLLRLRRRGS